MVWLNAGMACSWRGGGVGCGMWWCGAHTYKPSTPWQRGAEHVSGQPLLLDLGRAPYVLYGLNI